MQNRDIEAFENEGFSLSPVQRRIWARAQVGQTEPLAVQTLALKVPQQQAGLEVGAAIKALIEKHMLLNARFVTLATGRVVRLQALFEQGAIIHEQMNEIGALESRLAALAETPFMIEGGALVRWLRLQTPQGDIVAIAAHPLVADPEAMTVIAEDLACLIAGKPLPPITNVADPAAIATEELRLEFWRQELLARGVSSLPKKQTPLESGVPLILRHRETLAIGAGAFGVQTHIAAGSALAALLRRYCGEDGIRIGLVLADSGKRHVERSEDMLAIGLDCRTQMDFHTLARVFKAAQTQAARNSLPAATILQDIMCRSGGEDRALARVALEIRRQPDLPEGFSCLALPRASLHADVTIALLPDNSGSFAIDIAADAHHHEQALIARFAGHFGEMLSELTGNPDLPIRSVALVGKEELRNLSAPYEDSGAYDKRAVHEIIASKAAVMPHKIAIIFRDEEWTHGELDEKANRLANRLIELGVGREVPVAIHVKRSARAVMAILAVLKAGGAYIPVEPDHPPARNHHIVRDAGVKVVIAEAANRDRLPDGMEAAVIDLDVEDLSSCSATVPDVEIHPDQLAYIMYTSGSTGLPKGVAVEHGPLSRHNQATSRTYEMSSQSRELPFLPFSSDGGHERWMIPLMEGGSVVIPSVALWTPEETLAAIRRYGVNNASIPTTYMQQLAEWAIRTGEAPPLRLYSFGGEGLAQATFDLIGKALPAKILINGYGPTETIMTPMVWKTHAGASVTGAYAPIGRAVGLRRAYVLDPDMNPCPIGVTGELYLGGDGVARGYVGKQTLTAERFVPDPFGPLFGDTPGGRLYKSGDLARWDGNGTVEFVGRVDLQVKLRGYRIEPGEIEAALLAEPGVSEALVLLREDDGEKSLVGYAVPAQGATLDEDGLMARLKTHLPAHMLPAAIVILDRMPINPNAKLDRSALPMPKRRMRVIVPPDSPLETLILNLWREVLAVEAIGVTCNFFEVGGHSLGALKVLGRLKAARPGDSTTIADLFNQPTVRKLAAAIEAGGGVTGTQVVALRSGGTKPMLYCFPGLLVSTREYLRLVDHLGPEQPVTGFMCHSLNETKSMNVAVEDIVRPFAEHIAQASAGFPCAFLGWSWGGLLAHEAARQLQGRADIRMIGMVDVCDLGEDFAPGFIPQFDSGERENLKCDVEEWLTKSTMRADWDALINLMDPHCYNQFLKFIGNEKEPLPLDGPDVSSREHTFWVLIDNALVFRSHRLVSLDVPVRSFTAEDSLSRGLNLIDWRKLSPKAQAAEMVAGTNHLHIIGTPAFHARFKAGLNAAFL